MEKLREVFVCMDTLNPMAVLIGALSLAILIIWPRFIKKIPPSLVAVIVSAVLVKGLDLKVNTIGDLYTIPPACRCSICPISHLA